MVYCLYVQLHYFVGSYLLEKVHQDLVHGWTWSPAAFWEEQRLSPFRGCSWRSCGSCSADSSFWQPPRSLGCWLPRSWASSTLKQETIHVKTLYELKVMFTRLCFSPLLNAICAYYIFKITGSSCKERQTERSSVGKKTKQKHCVCFLLVRAAWSWEKFKKILKSSNTSHSAATLLVLHEGYNVQFLLILS